MRHLFIALVLTIAASAGAAERENMQLVGEARLKVLFWPVYDSRLFTPDGDFSSGERPIRLEIQYLRDIRAADLVAQTGVEWRDQGIEHPGMDYWLQSLSQLWPDVTENDTLTLTVDERERSHFYRNGELLGVIEDPDFGAHFLDIWLAPTTTRPELRTALIGAE